MLNVRNHMKKNIYKEVLVVFGVAVAICLLIAAYLYFSFKRDQQKLQQWQAKWVTMSVGDTMETVKTKVGTPDHTHGHTSKRTGAESMSWSYRLDVQERPLFPFRNSRVWHVEFKPSKTAEKPNHNSNWIVAWKTPKEGGS